MIRGGCLATSLPENVENFYYFFSMHESDGVNYSKQENDEQKNYLKYFSIFYFPICKC